MNRAFPVKFQHVGLDGDTHEVFAKVTTLLDPDYTNIDGYVGAEAKRAGNEAPHLARYVALRRGVEKERAKIDGKWYTIEQGAKAPPIVIDENDHTTLDHLLGYVIHHNPTLVTRERYREAFEDFTLEDEEIPQPTPFARNQEDVS